MTVAELIDFLRGEPQDMQVAYRLYSEQCLLTLDEIKVAELCYPRSDGWVQNKRPDMESQPYLLLPGN